ncbi:MAG: hypothetical protein RBR69_03475 [Candidatus Cloacimonadaceae bacterium]|nr:hypothetical protein [Candidatus Cloacimonadota bacterium]MDY0127178.1 hypothetical protein [Candidatus Cloacimonadaceae bacterium]MCB5254423.1 hypothetical protein [Candidatus Cloacimonadota bacterium]MCK9178097.1 hypothetical protein [Candidatus Cloacimonadota bacterium]MCK9241848.1 hypothetical protein [Candidatus Cloacimonadota bacterium]
MYSDKRPKVIVEFGSNSVKIMQIHSLKAQPQKDFRVPLRLAAELQPSGNLSEHAISSMIAQIQEVHRQYSQSSDIRIFGTQALRQAQNRQDIVKRIKQETSYPLHILSIQEEAEAAFRGIQSGMKLQGKVLCFDIGGASTEIVIASEKGSPKSQSFPIGAVNLSRNFYKHQPIRICEYNFMTAYISEQLRLKPFKRSISLIGTGGSVVTCAKVALGLPQIQEDKVNCFRLRKSELMRQIQTYRAMKSQDIAKIPGMDPARADVILPACMIMYRLMDIFGQEEIIVSSRGVRHGLVSMEV